MSEQREIRDLFNTNFSAYKDKKIVLYGVGPNTKAILDQADGFHIVGLMDSKLSGEVLWGKPVLSIPQAEEIKPDLIVIVANPVSVKVIYKRIKAFAEKNGIPVFDVNGVRLSDTRTLDQNGGSPYFQVDDAELRRAVEQHDLISFDLFDTLLMRKILHPADAFDLVQDKVRSLSGGKVEFVKARIRAEQELLVVTNPTLDEIYDRIAQEFHLKQSEKEQWKSLELSVERMLLTPRSGMKAVYEYARSLNKKIYLTSDMYYQTKDLRALLSGCGYEGYEELFVSCEHRITKREGLLRVMREQAQGRYGGNLKILHIGDHPLADIESGEAAGIDVFYVMSGRDMAGNLSAVFPEDPGESLDDRIAKGLLIRELFQDPFALHGSNGKIRIESAYEMAYCFAAPVITKFLFWMWEQAKSAGIDTILFASRDGYLLKQLFEQMMEHYQEQEFPQPLYYLTSRSASVLAAITDEEGIASAMEGYSGPPGELLSERFHLDEENIGTYDSRSGEDFKTCVLQYKTDILKLAAWERQNIRRYAGAVLGDKNRRLAFVDMMSRGTCQRNFTSITGRDALGLYFYYRNLESTDSGRRIDVNALYGNKSDFYGAREAFTSKFPVLEIILSSPDPTLRCMDADGSPVYEDEPRSPEQIRIMETMQRAVSDFFTAFLSVKGQNREDGLSLAYADWALGVLDGNYIELADEDIQKLVFDNRFEGRDTSLSEIVG